MISLALKDTPGIKIKRKFKWIFLFTLFFFLVLFAFQQSDLSTSITKNLLSYLICTDNLPPEKVFDGVYILGGDQESLTAKYETIAKLYVQGRCKAINILSRHGITEYNNALGRNLTNDEWSLMLLEGFGISTNDVRTLKIEPGLFGTYTEAKWISRVAEKNGWKNLLLITSPHHTKRVKQCFTHLIDGTAINFWVTSSKYNVGFWELLSEFFKLQFYQIFLLC